MAKRERELTVLDIFIFSLMRDGICTRYALKRDAGISVGAASPSIQRLMDKGFIAIPDPKYRVRGRRQRRPSRRKKLEYQAGLWGYPFLDSNWLARFEANSPTDTESVARLVALAQAEGKLEIAKTILSRAIGERRKRARQPAPDLKGPIRVVRYRSILQACESARLKAEATALGKIRAGLR